MSSKRPKKHACITCDAHFESKRNLQRHLDRKTPCGVVDPNRLSDDKKLMDYRCEFCGRPFSSAQTKRKHIRDHCKVVQNKSAKSDKDSEILIKQQNAKIADLETKLAKLANSRMPNILSA